LQGAGKACLIKKLLSLIYGQKERPDFVNGNTSDEICIGTGWIIKKGDSDAKDLFEWMLVEGMTRFKDEASLGSGQIVLGGSRCMMLAILGKPNSQNITQNQYGTHIQHIYSDRYIYTDDGVITTIQH